MEGKIQIKLPLGNKEGSMGKFVVKQAKSGYRFNLVAGNGEIIATSQTLSLIHI